MSGRLQGELPSPAGDIRLLREAIRLTREYVGYRTLPAVTGWTWFDAIKATGGFEGFGDCGCVLDPWMWGRTEGQLRYCNKPCDHDDDCGIVTNPGYPPQVSLTADHA